MLVIITPIWALPMFSIITERFMCIILTKLLTKYNTLSENQYGFRSNGSTVKDVLNFDEFFYDSLDDRNLTAGLIVDFDKRLIL